MEEPMRICGMNYLKGLENGIKGIEVKALSDEGKHQPPGGHQGEPQTEQSGSPGQASEDEEEVVKAAIIGCSSWPAKSPRTPQLLS